MNLRDIEFDTTDGAGDVGDELVDCWIMSRLQKTQKVVSDALDGYRFNEAALTIHNFMWHDYCDWYLEIIKPRLTGGEEEDRKRKARLAWHILERVLRLLHPMMPFITEEIYNTIPHEGESILCRTWPEADDSLVNDHAEKQMAYIQDLAGALLNIRGEYNVHPATVAAAHVSTSNEVERDTVTRYREYITTAAKLSPVHVHPAFEPDFPAGRAIVRGTQVFIPLEGIVDIAVEKQRLEKELSRLDNLLEKTELKLSKSEFLERAPEVVIAKEKEKKENLFENLQKVKKLLEGLQ
jgi:valyl-tRNA synthetase